MDFELSDEQKAVRDAFARFADQRIVPQAAALDEARAFPRELFGELAGLGLFGMRYPEEVGGSGMALAEFCLALEEIARGSMSLAGAAAMQSLMGTKFLQMLGNADVVERLFRPALAGKKIGGICMTEPDAGSDLGSISTTARRVDGGYVIDGQKTWITSAPVADFFTVFARTGKESLGVFLVERGAPGLELGRPIEKLGVRSSLTSEVHLSDVPASAVLGDPESGTKYLREILAEIRVVTAALALGVGRAAYEEAKRYASERQQFGRPIERFELVQEHLAEMATDLEAARRLTQWAAWRSDQKLPNAREASMAKLFASEAAHRICDRAARVTASYGFAAESPIQRYLRDARFVLIGGGTSEILRVNIARDS